MAQTVVGFFDDAAEAQRAVEQLVSNGFDRSSIDVSSGAGRGTDTMSTSGSRDNDGDRENGITRFFKNLFGDDDDEATRYSRVGLRSNSIVTVHARSSDEAERAADLLDDYGAVNVNERDADYSRTGTSGDYDRTSSERTTPGYTGTGSDTDYDRTTTYSDTDRRSDVGDTSDRDTTINRVEENLEIGKRTVERGGVRVRSRIVERPVEENIRLREEHVTVERNPVDRAVGSDELANFEERDIELTERAEVPVVNKEARVVEEIRVSKDVDEREETIRDTVRSTEVDVENLGTNNTRGTNNLNTGNTTNLDTDFDDDTTRNRNTRID
jgi:stress response protein YsnF